MDTFKKISCVIFVFLIIFVSSLPVFSAEADRVALQFGSPYYMFLGFKNPNTDLWSYNGSWSSTDYSSSSPGVGNPSALPTESYLHATLINSVMSTYRDWAYGFCGSIVDDNGQLASFQNDYTYSISFAIRMGFSRAVGTGAIQMDPVYFQDTYELWITNNHPTGRGSYLDPTFDPYGLVPVDGSLFSNFVSSTDFVYTGTGVDRYNNTVDLFDVFYSFAFHIPSFEDAPIAPYSFVSLVAFASLPQGISGTSFQYIGWQSIEGWYDPTGEIADDLESEVDQIIAGQKEAADYALDQEQLANEEALQGALDDANTDDLLLADKFGSGLVSLYNALTYSGTSFSIKLPASGTVPFLNTELWSETEIPIKDYIDNVPSAVWVVVNFILWLCVAFSIIHLVHKIIDWINGHAFKE